MTQILVTLNEDATTLHVRKAIELPFENYWIAAVASSFYMSSVAKVVQIERNAKQIVIYLHFRDAAYFRGKASKLLFSFTFRYFLLIILWTHTIFRV